MEKAIAIGFAGAGSLTAGGAAFSAATTAEPLAWEPQVERRRAAKNRFRQAVAITLCRRMVQDPSQKVAEVGFSLSAVGTIGRRWQWGNRGRCHVWRRKTNRGFAGL